MSITKTELQNILDETTDNDKTLRSRIEELAKTSKARKEKAQFIDTITRLNVALAEAAGTKPREIDPAVTEYYTHCDDVLAYRVDGYYIAVNAMLKYPNTHSIELSKSRWGFEIASFRVKPFGPEGAVALAVACIDHLNNENPRSSCH